MTPASSYCHRAGCPGHVVVSRETHHNDLSRYAEVSDALADALDLVRGERDRMLRETRSKGITLAELAEATGLMVARVHQITEREGK